MAAPSKGTNVQPSGTPMGPISPDPSHPGMVPQRVVPSGPYYKQAGANGGKSK